MNTKETIHKYCLKMDSNRLLWGDLNMVYWIKSLALCFLCFHGPNLSGWSKVLVKLPVPGAGWGGVLLILKIVRQGPTTLIFGAVGVCLDIFLSSIISLFFLPLSGRRSA